MFLIMYHSATYFNNRFVHRMFILTLLLLTTTSFIYAQQLTCTFTQPTQTLTLTLSPITQTHLPSLPYIVKCTHETKVLINATPQSGNGSHLYTRNTLPIHLTFLHTNGLFEYDIREENKVPRHTLKAYTENEKPEVTKTFIATYWMYIVPFLVIMLLTSGGSEEEAEEAKRIASHDTANVKITLNANGSK